MDAVVFSAVMLSVVQQWVRLNSFLCTIQCSWRHTMWYTTKVEHVQRKSGEHLEQQFRIIFERLNAVNTQEALTLISNHATPRSLNPNLFVSDVYFARRDREDSLR